MELRRDLSDLRKISRSACCFMGLSHLLYLKDYVKGVFFAICELGFIACIPFIIRKIAGLVTLGSPHPELPIKMRDNSIFMMIGQVFR